MGEPEAARPDPDALLQEARKSGRGRLKIFLGASPGVGKTYAMLEEARARRRAGIDVAVALVETHGREETAALLADLEYLPRRSFEYRGQTLEELDIDQLLARKPQLALIDEFAHTNTPGSRHPKRWQDVMEVLDAGIDVTTTLNIQHIESLNDVVARITGVRVQETVPDEVLSRADDIELIDLPPEELMNRLRAGKIYIPAQIGRALDNFFNKGNLTALRELALRTAASRVDAEMINWMRSNAVSGPWPAQERLLVCINEAPVAKALIRAAKRMADRAKIPWIAATVITAQREALGAGAQELTSEALRLAEALGGEAVTLHAESNAAAELLTFARKRNVTRLVVGRPRRKGLKGFFREDVADKLVDSAVDFEVTVVAQHARAARRRIDLTASAGYRHWTPPVRALLEAVAATSAATAVAWPFWPHLPVASLAVFYLVAVLVVAFRNGLWGAALGSALGFLAYNYFFTTPYYTLAVEQHEAIVGLLVFMVSSAVTGTLASRLKKQVEGMRIAQRRTETLFEFARKIARATQADDVLWAAAAHLATTLNCRSLIMMPDADGLLQQVQGHPSIEEDLDPRVEMAARWAFEKNEPAGAGTGTLPASEWLFVPLATATASLGVIGVLFRDPRRFNDPEMRRLLLAVEDQIAVAVERFNLAADVEATKVRAEGEKLQTALLNSVSHDLRTPLVSVIGALTAISDSNAPLSDEDKRVLNAGALDEARRLDRYVQNLLDMTKLGYGALRPKSTPVDLREIVGRARGELARTLTLHPLTVEMAADLPRVHVDPVLIGQALVNVLDNAAKFSPDGSPIIIRAREDNGFVRLDVIDRGPGIPLEDREKVFDMFHRLRQEDGQPAGTGLGLAIVRGLVEAHGGTVEAQTGDDGIGTTIRLRLPIASAQTVPEEAR
ncbi:MULTISPECIES: sensor histidine kinase KdpD [unclassified Beijerinckia]|uniref:sensor histidine kinase n=1 Tax=unclassified Beijerinckia TaxID=2638183 RepID=UPI000894C4ED|nr:MULTISPECIES: sensor histidine kinase KdpD [unclassified Beijerinckia]MDH7795076.1 two-component system sensor histidine kinase KdpD [Beijerinckia sp. GAS462]SEB86599.1 two-component system, OmpR family, sensor histidine kinase KdpD [Beijerinckia sp. 28-YEA-48]